MKTLKLPQISIERAVAFMTPVFAIAATAGTGWVATHFPGLPKINPAEVTALMGLGMFTAGSAALKWLHGRAHYVQDQEKAKADAAKLSTNPAVVDVEAASKAHEGELLAAVDARATVAVQQALTSALAGLSAVPPAA